MERWLRRNFAAVRVLSINANMNNPEYQRLRDLAWKGDLGPEERARAKEFLPIGSQRELEAEQQFTRCIQRLPDASVSSNFTARVMQSVIRSAPVSRLSWWHRLALLKWAPRLAVAALTVCFGILSVQQYKSAQHTRMAHDLASVSELAQLSDMDWLDNFETINRMSQVEAADDDLLMSLR